MPHCSRDDCIFIIELKKKVEILEQRIQKVYDMSDPQTPAGSERRRILKGFDC